MKYVHSTYRECNREKDSDEVSLHMKPTNTSWHFSLSETLMKRKLSLTPYKTN